MDVLKEKLVPANIEGKQTDLSYSRKFDSEADAKDAFQRACKRLQNPLIWHTLCGTLSPTFQLIGKDGSQADRLAEAGDYFRIELPAFGNRAGDGSDWVILEAMEKQFNKGATEEGFGMRIRASQNPNSKSNQTAHFFKDAATSSFIVMRDANCVRTFYFGRNELANKETDSTIDNIRNTLIAAGGFIGLSELQWNTLLHALLEPELG